MNARQTGEVKAFRMGFAYGRSTHEEITARQISALHPELSCDEIDAFAQGMLDGIADDRWRLNRIGEIEKGGTE